jgi:hypothetical protein
MIKDPSRVRADELGKTLRLVRGRHAQRPHFMEHDRYAAFRDLPGRLRTREPAADDMNGL